jgi:TolA-binding protein
MHASTGTQARRLRERPRAARLALALGPLWLAAGPALAGEVEEANSRLAELEERVRVLGSEFRPEAPPDPDAAMRRVVDAEMLFKLKNYSEAATVLLDVVEKHPGAQGYDDALVLLGESLFQQRDYNSARRYFAMEAKRGGSSRLEQRALQRLVEIALHTGDFENVDLYLQRLESVSPAELEPSVPYVRGKYAFFRGRPDQALAVFATIPPTSPYYLQSLYFTATLQVQKGQYTPALAIFDGIVKSQPRNEQEKEIQDLARMAVGRLTYEQDQFLAAREAYSGITRQSLHFDEAMNELAWTSIKAKDYDSAYRALDLTLLQNPDSPQAPELRLLMGNLHVRLGNFALANEAFVQGRDQYEPIQRQLRETLDKSQVDRKYFESLIGKGMEKFDITALLPKDAVKWVKTDPEVARLVALTEDVGELQRGIRDAEQILSRLELATSGQLQVGIFPDLAASRTRTSEVLNQLVQIRNKLVGKMRALTAGSLAPEEKARLEQLAVERAVAEKQLESLPITAAGLHERERRARAGLDQLDAQASELNVMVQGMDAELVAIDQYYIKSRADQKIKAEELVGPVAGLREAIVELRGSIDRVRNSIAEAAREATVAVATGDDERGAIAVLVGAQKRERDLYQTVRPRLSGSGQRDFDGYASLLGRADGVQAGVAELDGRIDAAARKRVGELRTQLGGIKSELVACNQKLGGITTESQDVGSGLALIMLSKVTDRFYQLVVQSDVGLVDVAWGLKDSRTSTVSKLINQQKMELKTVEEDFRPLLQEEK